MSLLSGWHWIAISIIAVTHIVGGIAAFGSTILAVALLVAFGGADRLDAWVGVLAACGMCQALMLVVTERHAVDWRALGWMVPCAAVTLPLGRWLVQRTDAHAIGFGLGLILAVAGLLELRGRADRGRLPRPVQGALLAASGVVHGGFASGGSVLVPLMRWVYPTRDAFRATLAAMWVALNGLLLTVVVSGYLVSGAPAPESPGVAMAFLGIACVAALLGTRAGQAIARRVNERVFARIVACVMVGVGALYLSRPLWA